MADRDDMIRKVQALWNKADDPATTEPEREAFIAKARDLMAKYTIDEMVLEEASGQKEAVVLADIRMTVEGDTTAFVDDQRILLGHFIAINNRCRTVIQTRDASVDAKTGTIKGGSFLVVVGFKSDVDMVKDLYVSLGMDMLTAMFGEKLDHVPARQRNDKMASFCDGYAMRIDERLRQINNKVHQMAADRDQETGSSMALVLRSKELEVKDTFSNMFPNLKQQKIKTFKYDGNYAERGRQAANNADLGQNKVSGGSKGEIGG